MRVNIPVAASVIFAAAIAATTPAAAPGSASEAAGGAVITKVGDYPVRYDRYGDGLTEAVHGSATTLTVDYSNADPGTYTIDWSCGTGDGGWEHRFTSQIPDDAPDGVIVYSIDTTEPSLSCTFLLQHDYVTGYFVRLLQLDPVLETSHFENPTGPVVYPRVHADWWRAHFQTNSPAEVTTSVRNRHGRLVFTETSGTRRITHGGDQSRDWAAHAAWDGRRANGTTAPLGTYRVRILVRSTRGSGQQLVGPLKVTVKPGRRPITVQARQAGMSGRSIARGGCFAADQVTNDVWLNCSPSDGSPSALARSTWTFTVPRNARLIDWRVAGGLGGDDRPRVGSIRKTITRPNSRTFKVRVNVTGRRSYAVTDVYLSYRYLK